VLLLTDVIVRESYEPDFWKVGFSSKMEHVGSGAGQFTAVSVNVNDISSELLTTDVQSSSPSYPAG